jgi:tetratricopeptide (TPR) repeat protein
MLKIKKLKPNNHLIAFTIILLITFGIYWNSLQGDFIWDDKDLILSNAGYLNDWRNLFSVFIKPFFGKASTYRPLLIVSFIFDYQLWDSHSFGFHYTNLLLHTANAFMVYLLVFILFKHRYLSLFSSLLFATHPIQTEAVAWISGRNDVILTFFSLLAIIFYLRWQNHTGTRRLLTFIGFLLAFGCVLLTKESGIIVFFLIMIVDYFFQPALPARFDSKRIAYLSIILVSLLYIYLRMNILGKLGINIAPIGEDFIRRYLGVFIIYTYYFKMLLFPFHQTANPFMPYLNSVNDPVVISSFLFVFSLVLIIAICWKHLREVSFIILWIIITLLPVSGIISLTVPALEHRLYLGTIGFSILLPLLIYRVSSLRTNGAFFEGIKKVMTSLLLVLIIIYCTKTVSRNTIWKDESHFWLKTIQDSPFSVFAHNNLGLVYADDRQYRRAIDEFRKALSLNPGAANVHANLGGVYVAKGLYKKGIDAYEKALKLRPQKAKFYNDLGNIYYHMLREYKLSSKTDLEGANDHIAIHDAQELYQKSLDNYRRALQLNPIDAGFHNNLGDLYYLEQSYQRALGEYKLAIKCNSYYTEAYNNLGLVHFKRKHYNDAQKAFFKALELNPNFAEAYNNLALVYLDKGLYQKALKEFTTALRLMPENAEVHFNLALVYLRGFKDKEKVIYYLKESLRLDPHQSRAVMIKEVLTQLGYLF